MGWWPFGSAPSKDDAAAQQPTFPSPPVGSPLVPPPDLPPSLRGSSPAVFTGFSPPPGVSADATSTDKSKVAAGGSLFDALPSFSSDSDYGSEELSKYASPYRESSGYKDRSYASSDRYITNPRIRNCLDSIALGVKTGAAIGGIFGGLSGTYMSFVHKNVFMLPMAIVGGAMSFGLFLGCGMIVRCEPPLSVASRYTHTHYSISSPSPENPHPSLTPPPYLFAESRPFSRLPQGAPPS